MISVTMSVSLLLCFNAVTGKIRRHRVLIMQMYMHEKFNKQTTVPGVSALTKEQREEIMTLQREL